MNHGRDDTWPKGWPRGPAASEVQVRRSNNLRILILIVNTAILITFVRNAVALRENRERLDHLQWMCAPVDTIQVLTSTTNAG